MKHYPLGLPSWERSVRAAELVKSRLLRATAALEMAHIRYAVIGDNAVVAWVERVAPSAARLAQDVVLLIRRSDLESAKLTLEPAGFVFKHATNLGLFLDGPKTKSRNEIHVVFSGERTNPEDMFPAPDVSDSERGDAFHILRLDALVRMTLTSYRDKDRTHLRDLIGVGLVDESWVKTLPEELAVRLQHLFDTPDG